MDIEQIREIVRRCKDFTKAEILYRVGGGILITRTCYLNPSHNSLNIDGFDEIPAEYRESYKKEFTELPCLTVVLSLDRNHTGYDQPSLQIFPRNVDSIRLLREYLGENEGVEFCNGVEIRTRDETKNLQTVLGYLLNQNDLEMLLGQEKTTSIKIASFLENGKPQEIYTVEPILSISALVYAP